ncbi:MAG: hypothetical protein B7Z31_00150 [Rhodobacterales bacterium 12-65-15]|nr:MAG: hypothetical protein B7Z31_00150 [Rhodobacterales bacterium 12-65-15]
MAHLTAWAARHRVTPEALAELRALLLPPDVGMAVPGTSEAAIQTQVRLEASRLGGRLWRNSVGAGILQDGSFVRWGLCNDSTQLNKIVKSADIVGIMQVQITQEHVGQVFGRFVSREIKAAGWKWRGTPHEVAQGRWAEMINLLGGDAAIVSGVGSLEAYRK